MRVSPPFTVERQYRRVDGSTQTVVRVRGGRVVSVVVPGGLARGDVINAVIVAAIDKLGPLPARETWEA